MLRLQGKDRLIASVLALANLGIQNNNTDLTKTVFRGG
jgi:hypothetical protein